MLKKQIAEVNREADMFLWKRRADVLINRKLSAKADGVVVKDSQSGWPEEYLVRLRVLYRNVCLEEAIRAFANQFAEQSPVPFVRRSSPLGRPIAVHQAVVEYIGTLVAVVLIEFGVCASKPNVVTPRRHATHDAEHGAWYVCCMGDAPEP